MTEKLKMQSMDKVQYNIEKIREMFPNAVTEVKRGDKVELAVDFEALKQELSEALIEDKQERYQMTWPDKGKAKVLANTQISATLRPIRERSVDFDTTQNLYIEGDNLDVLKLLRETYLGKIKVIYIDPPYNTGNDFVYEDNFAQSAEKYAERNGEHDEVGNRLFQNTESNGRFHTDWLNMIYPRLKVAKDLLSDDGVIFISIGQDEIHNCIAICNEIFSSQNHVGTISRMMKSGGNKGQYFSPNIEYVLVYAKNISNLEVFREPLSEEIVKTYNHIEASGEKEGERFTIKGLCQPGLGNRPNQRYWIEAPDGSFLIPKGATFPSVVKEGEKIVPTDNDTCWKWTFDRYLEEKKAGNILFQKNSNSTALVDEKHKVAKWNVFNKIWLSDRIDEGRVPVDYIGKWENRISSQELKELNIPFDFAKPTALIAYLISLVGHTNNSIILDFFSGSATTAHAVMQLNAEDGGNRKFIMVQLPEVCDETSEAYKAGYKTICDIGEERIRRAGKKILDSNGRRDIYIKAITDVVKVKSVETSLYLFARETEEKYVEDENLPEVQYEYVHDHIIQIINEGTLLGDDTKLYDKYENAIGNTVDRLAQLLCGLTYGVDVGFRVFKLDTSNMQEVYYNPHAISQTLLDGTIDNIKPDRTSEDLLFQVMLDLGVELSAKIEEKTVCGKTVFAVNGNDVIACFDENITNEVIVEIAKKQPLYAVFRDKSFATDSVGINNEQLFKTYSPTTIIKVL